MTEAAGLSARLVDHMVGDRAGLEKLMELEGSRALHEEFLLAESGTLPDRQTRLTRVRITGIRAWLQHLATAIAAEWESSPPDFPSTMQRWINQGSERLEALELEEQAQVEREGLAGDPQVDARRVTLAAYVRLFAEGIGGSVPALGVTGSELGQRVAAGMRRASGFRAEVEKASFEAWSGSEMDGVLEDARQSAAPPEPRIIRMLEAAAVWSYMRAFTDVLEEVLAGPAEAGA
ncbi:MAG: hypothetical protein H6531_02670 [Actinobacteria bacterium]|nr:hypothetical protein [Thermoleophilia bacterium]MCB9010719.1 hypothetical protein [Actinomycetota bacterium]